MSLDITCNDTICALSTAQGLGAIAIVRVSGPRSHEILKQCFKRSSSKETKPFISMHGSFVQGHEIIDDVMALLFLGKKSFTGEDSFEIHCHGNKLIIEQILAVICELGARLAEPGEFSMRGVLNGKLDLTQAESIYDLIHAKSVKAQKVALKGVRGGLNDKTIGTREIIVDVLAEIEARMDFPDEDLGGYDKTHLLIKLNSAISELDKLLINAEQSLRLREGARIVICGRPNAGKSTLFNLLCGDDKAIVHHSAGTTRDVIETEMELFGIPITLVDVAGIREADNSGEIELIGINKATMELDRAHVIIWLADCMSKTPFDDILLKSALEKTDAHVLRVLNKCELISKTDHDVCISAKTGLGVDKLKNMISTHLLGAQSLSEELFITRSRQKEELLLAHNALKEAKLALTNNMSDEVVTSELRNAGLAFDRLFGTTLSEDILDKIFSQFCIGK